MKNLGLLLFVGALGTAAHAGTNYIQDGDFSMPAQGGGWSLYSNTTGWYAEYNADSGAIEPIEIGNQSLYGVTGWAGASTQNLEINSDGPSTVSQDVAGLTSGKSYDLSFQYGMRAGGPQDTVGRDNFDVYWDGSLIAQIVPSSTVAQTENLSVVAGAANKLSFVGTGYAGNSYGGEVGNVSLTSTPAPAGLLSFAVGVFGLARKRKSA